MHLLKTDVAASDAENAEIVFAELAANAATHAPGPVEAWLNGPGKDPVLHFRDHGPGFRFDRVPPMPTGEHGRGLVIIARLSRALEVTPMPDGGSLVRVTLRTDHAAPESHSIR